MARKRFSGAQIVSNLRDADVLLGQGLTVESVCKRLENTNKAYYRWREDYGGMKVDQAKRHKEMERENARLKRLVAELSLDKQMLQEVAEGNF